MSENVQNIRQSHKLQHESHEKLVSGINNRRINPIGEENQRGIFHEDTPVTIICYCNEATNLQNPKILLIPLCT